MNAIDEIQNIKSVKGIKQQKHIHLQFKVWNITKDNFTYL